MPTAHKAWCGWDVFLLAQQTKNATTEFSRQESKRMATSLALIRRRRDFRWATTKSMHNSETVMPILQAKTLDDTRSFDRMRDKRLEEHCHTHCICRPSLGLDGQVESKAGRHARSGLLISCCCYAERPAVSQRRTSLSCSHPGESPTWLCHPGG